MEAKGQFEQKYSLGERAQHFVLQMIDQAQGLRYHHDEAKEEGSDIAVIGLDLRPYGIEVKAIQNFLTRDNTGLSPCGELCFEIMSKYKKEPGSLYEWIFPELWTLQHEGKGRPAVRPKRIHYVLYGNDATREYPFCVVTFDTASLLSELQAMGKKWGCKAGGARGQGKNLPPAFYVSNAKGTLKTCTAVMRIREANFGRV